MWKFIKSSSSIKNWYEHEKKELCFFGRSNVGKSSLINAIVNNKKMAKVSNTPGRTQLINYFESESDKVIVDLPGYGYAKMPLSKKEEMIKMIDEYFINSTKIKMIFLLFDIKVGFQKEDIEIYNYLKSLNLPITFIGTKLDKVNQSELYKSTKNEILLNEKYFLVSSQNKKNINKLEEYIKNL
ncbi:MAG: ribosome biogenesis GTP-binding protein YihA/YsxC [Metamycoplasmataceae bacterium]